ncbi:hypothetical protein AAHA92_08147 [Salvia divinorum]|uniref:Uncharacterized protein n=1 Tax=Salvia divinorum TaxID=28513 RepID=A0ABD1HM98_SALDI
MESRVFNSRNRIFEDDDAQSQRSKYTSLRDLKLVTSIALRGAPCLRPRNYNPAAGNPLLRRAAMLYGRTGAPRPLRKSSSMCLCSRTPRWMKESMQVCFGFNIDHRDID